MTKLAPEWVRTSDPVIRSPARYRWTTAPACINVMGRCIVMVARGSMYDIRQSRAPRRLSDWRGASEVSAGRTGVRDRVAD